MARILIADSDAATVQTVEVAVRDRASRVVTVTGLDDLLQQLQDHDWDLALVDQDLPGFDAAALLPTLVQSSGSPPVVLLAAFGSIEDAVDAVRRGATDFLAKPFTPEQIELIIDRAVDHGALVRENRDLRKALDDRVKLGSVASVDPRMQRILKTVAAVAETRTTVLLTGESGTGKTMLARSLHTASDRADRPFVEVNCGAMPENLLESELFGHVRGAFTGAVKDRPGKFEAAHRGTIFLDEIGTASPGLQVKLLRVLQDRVVERVGDSERIEVDVRVVLATNLDLATEVREGRFREDLYYRIHVVALEVPPLRERPDDVPPLAEHFLERFRAETGKPVRGFSREAMQLLSAAAWPGNVRQLENVIERAVVLCESERIGVADLPHEFAVPSLGPSRSSPSPQSLLGDLGLSADAHLLPLREALEGPERLLIERALEHFDGNRQRTADSLGINRSTLFHKMRKLGID